MRLADFILANTEPILADWEAFARGVWPGGETDPVELRDHAEDILRATARDMKSVQSPAQQSDKSKGEGDAGEISLRLNGASDVHAVGRVASGFDLLAVVAEYRALRASVVRLWRASAPNPDLRDLDDLTRFNESIDQSLTEAVRSFTRRLDRSRQTFLAMLGHDLRNPLNALMLSAELMSQGGQDDADSAEAAAQVSASGAVMTRLISDLLDLAGTALGAGMPISPAPMELGQLCRDVVAEIGAGHSACTVHFESHGDLAGEWDAARLRQLLSNLLANAVQHGGANCRVDLSARGAGPDVLLTVRNQGPPIPRDALAIIFDPLARGSSPEMQNRRRPGSIGLGLYIAREVVTAHGGAIDVTSSAGAGTVFTVRLPRRRAGRETAPAAR